MEPVSRVAEQLLISRGGGGIGVTECCVRGRGRRVRGKTVRWVVAMATRTTRGSMQTWRWTTCKDRKQDSLAKTDSNSKLTFIVLYLCKADSKRLEQWASSQNTQSCAFTPTQDITIGDLLEIYWKYVSLCLFACLIILFVSLLKSLMASPDRMHRAYFSFTGAETMFATLFSSKYQQYWANFD